MVAKQFDYTIRWITKNDFPSKWPELATIIKEYLNTNDHYDSKVFVGLYCLKSVCKRYEYEFNLKREPLNEIVDELFPKCEEIANSVLSDNSDQGCRLKNVIGQWFYIANQLFLTNRYKTPESLESLIAFSKTWLEAEIDENLTTKTDDIETINQRWKTQQWKLKQTSMHFLFRMFQKYSSTDYLEEELKPVAEHWIQNYAEGIINIAVSLISKTPDLFISPKVISFCFKTVSTGINLLRVAQFVVPHIESLLSSYVIPLILLTEKDIEDFEWDPIEFVRKTRDTSDVMYTAKSSVLDFITHATRYRSNKEDETAIPDYWEYYFQYCIDNLTEYTKQDSPDFRIKDALLLSIGQMSSTLTKYDKFLPNLEAVLKELALPDLTTENELLKYRACWMYGEFWRLEIDHEHRMEAGKCLFNNMHDDNLPIKITASSSLYKTLKNEDLKEAFKPELPRILEAYLSLLDSVDSEELFSGLEEIVTIYDDCIEPFAIDLCKKLVENYKKIISKEDDDDTFNSLGMAASTLVTTVKLILEAIKHNSELLTQLEPIVFPMVMTTLTPDGLEYLDEALECLTLIMSATKTITDKMWQVFPYLFKIGKF